MARTTPKIKSELDYRLEVIPLDNANGGGFLAFCYDLPGCMSDGATLEEVAYNGYDAIKSYIGACKKWKIPVPPPSKRPHPLGAKGWKAGGKEFTVIPLNALDYKNDQEHSEYVRKRIEEFHSHL